MVKDIIIGTLIMIIVMIVVMGALSIGEKSECRYWEQAQMVFAQWQIDQCAHYQINLQD